MPGHSLIGSVATLDSPSVTWTENPGSIHPAAVAAQQAQPPQAGLAFEAPRYVVQEGDRLVGRRQHELPGCSTDGASSSVSISLVRSGCSPVGSMCGSGGSRRP
jgi:hypothetical protein